MEIVINIESDHNITLNEKSLKLGVWIPHELYEAIKNDQVTACSSLLARHRLAVYQSRPFLSRFVIGEWK